MNLKITLANIFRFLIPLIAFMQYQRHLNYYRDKGYNRDVSFAYKDYINYYQKETDSWLIRHFWTEDRKAFAICLGSLLAFIGLIVFICVCGSRAQNYQY